jgi:hypothetical protein
MYFYLRAFKKTIIAFTESETKLLKEVIKKRLALEDKLYRKSALESEAAVRVLP